ncbi:ion channel DMI1 isoform X1 [Juglans microcarpa x Juglans regia]|uniref:ion channel DMI1 isoform X1 n=2 Tax=Juglans microcarpa x Juglans regia TaxID=2249226 RepID=UPI001B7DFB3E|nr:ion channel DMI1 isoform X1 [Juglans microcarpa x Juglans regia]
MPETNEDPTPGPSPSKFERPPLLKKFKTIAEHAEPTPHFPGPLFPAVRRISTLPNSRSSLRPSDLRVSVTNGDDSSSRHDNRLSDRDWIYPPFLGAYPARGRAVPVKLNSTKSRKLEQSDSSLPGRSMDVRLADETRRIPAPVNKSNDSDDRDSDAKKPFVPSSQASVSPLSVCRTRGFKQSFILYLLSFTCVISVPYAVYLQNKVEKLQEENGNLYRLCGVKEVRGGSMNDLPFEHDSPFSYFSCAAGRTVALYTVVVTLIMLFLPYKYLDYLPQIKSLSKRTKMNKEEVPLKKRIAYMVDVCFSVYPYAKLLALLFATIFLIGFGGLALYAVSESSFAEALWLSWTFVADSGNHADRVGTGPRIVSVSISSGGMLIFAMMLGLVSDAISEKVDSLRKGKSEVIERNHILILGWSDKLGSLLKQLAIANKSVGGGVVVVLAERDKEEMEMDIAKLEFDLMGTSVICRSGSPLILADLKKVSVSKARAIIVLASDENADQSDARALRVVLSLTGVKEGLRGHVVVEMSDLDNEPLVKLVGGELIETVVAHDVIGRLMIKCALQPGLAQVWEDILGFENAEFYIKRWPQLDGLHFGDALISFPDAIPCGIKVAAEGGKIILNPDDSYVLKEGDEVLVIAEDDDTYAPGPLPEVCRGLFRKIPDPPKYPERILFCGWRRDIDDMIMVLEAFLAPGSELWMFNEVPEKEREKKLTDGELDISRLENIKLVHREGNAVIRRHLESLPLETFDSILILADESLEDSVVHSDSRSLATLLLIRDIQSKRLPFKDKKSTSLRSSGFSHSSWIREMQQASDKSIIISEILDSRTRNLVSVSRISDYVLSNELVSMALAMVAEDKQINRVLEELFAEEGNEMCIKPAEFYLFDQEELRFYDIMIRGRQRREIVIGYRLANAELAIINPYLKSEPRKWSLDDVFVVISWGE